MLENNGNVMIGRVWRVIYLRTFGILSNPVLLLISDLMLQNNLIDCNPEFYLMIADVINYEFRTNHFRPHMNVIITIDKNNISLNEIYR